MSVRVRLTRVGSRKNPIWRVVVADQRSPRDGRVIETIGRYNAQADPSEIVIDEERARHWLDRGAQPSETVRKLLRTKGIATRARYARRSSTATRRHWSTSPTRSPSSPTTRTTAR